MNIKQIIKKIFSIFSCIVLLSSVTYNQLLMAEEICVPISSQPFGYTGDVSGKRVYTKEEYTFECTNTTTKVGTCKTWEEEYQEFDVSGLDVDVYYKSEKFQGGIGEALGVAQAYDKINGLWSGWHGLCMDGSDDGNWDWMNDPYVLAGFALSAIGGAATAGVGNGAIGSVGQYSSEQVKYVARMAVCAARAGLDAGKMIEEYEDDGEECDEVDEICGEVDEICGEEDAADDDTNIFTIPEDEYNQLVTNNPDIIDNMVIIDGVGTGVLTLKVIAGDVNKSGMSSDEAQKAAKEAKEKALKIKAAMTTIQLAACVNGSDTGSGSSSSSDSASSLLSAKNIALMALGSINPLLGLAAQVASKMYDSIASSVDTCNNLDDAKGKGSRHEATYHARKYDMCHLIEVVEDGDKTWNTYQRRFRYCCYDDKTTRIIVEQSKAQFAKDWEHCTDITLKELEVISFSACDPEELDSSINGVTLPADATIAERMGAYQFTHKCIDTREYIDVMLEKFGGEDMLIDSSDAERILEELR
ncbi:hypothetical protein [Sulfurimonas sp.]|uniref:hypothetical protein n=1 Tax=Sulfurimonas sp. TaxID=2022749 RepID=UPI0025F14093|nr:hypothetical protein [Sulfurimonas sp.]